MAFLYKLKKLPYDRIKEPCSGLLQELDFKLLEIIKFSDDLQKFENLGFCRFNSKKIFAQIF